MARTFRLNNEDDDRVLRERARRAEPILRDGEAMRVPLQMMDSVDNGRAAIEQAKRDTYAAGERLGLHNKPDMRITDGGGNTGVALNRPGYRIADTDVMRDERQRAHDEYLHDLTSAWRGNPVPDQPEAVRQDSMMMDEIYRTYDAEISQRWRTS
jgi:hypothetical protein